MQHSTLLKGPQGITHQGIFHKGDAIGQVKAKIAEQQARLKELEQKKHEAENSEIVEIVPPSKLQQK